MSNERETHVGITCDREDFCRENQFPNPCHEIDPMRVTVPADWTFRVYMDELNETQPLPNCKLGYHRYRTSTEFPRWEEEDS